MVALRVNDITNPTILKKIQVPLNKVNLMNELNQVVNGNPQRSLDSEFQLDRMIRRQQDLELQEAERIVRERYQLEEAKRKQKKKEEEDEKLLKKHEEDLRLQKLEKIGNEPESSPETAQVSFRLPNGQKVDRRFNKQENIDILYEFVETLGVVNFEILINFPLKILNEKSLNLEETGIFPKSVVIVREII